VSRFSFNSRSTLRALPRSNEGAVHRHPDLVSERSGTRRYTKLTRRYTKRENCTCFNSIPRSWIFVLLRGASRPAFHSLPTAYPKIPERSGTQPEACDKCRVCGKLLS
jgi:hypothetical protein